MLPRAEGGKRDWLPMARRDPFRGAGSVLKLDCGDGCVTLYTY